MRRMATVLALGAALLCGGCGGGGGGPEPTVDAEEFARCVVNRTGAIPVAPQAVPLSSALRAAAASGRRVAGSVMPAPRGFAVFAGSQRRFAPAGYGASDFVPAAFVAFSAPGAAADHEDDADRRVGNLLIVYEGDPPDGETGLVEQCLEKLGA